MRQTARNIFSSLHTNGDVLYLLRRTRLNQGYGKSPVSSCVVSIFILKKQYADNRLHPNAAKIGFATVDPIRFLADDCLQCYLTMALPRMFSDSLSSITTTHASGTLQSITSQLPVTAASNPAVIDESTSVVQTTWMQSLQFTAATSFVSAESSVQLSETFASSSVLYMRITEVPWSFTSLDNQHQSEYEFIQTQYVCSSLAKQYGYSEVLPGRMPLFLMNKFTNTLRLKSKIVLGQAQMRTKGYKQFSACALNQKRVLRETFLVYQLMFVLLIQAIVFNGKAITPIQLCDDTAFLTHKFKLALRLQRRYRMMTCNQYLSTEFLNQQPLTEAFVKV